MMHRRTSPLPIPGSSPCLRVCLAFGSLFILLIVTILACDVQKPNGGYPQPVAGPFTAKDCEIPGMPPPATNEDEIFDTSIYCVFHTGGSLNGVMYFHLDYAKNADDALKSYSSSHDDFVKNYADYIAVTDTLEELFVMKVTGGLNQPDTFTDIDAVQIYEKHFVILIKGKLNNTNQSAVQGMVIDLFRYGMSTADDHYPGYQ
jgi:hypothetical protein